MTSAAQVLAGLASGPLAVALQVLQDRARELGSDPALRAEDRARLEALAENLGRARGAEAFADAAALAEALRDARAALEDQR